MPATPTTIGSTSSSCEPPSSDRGRRFLGYGRQSIDRSRYRCGRDVLQSDFLTQGPAVERFEAALAERGGPPCGRGQQRHRRAASRLPRRRHWARRSRAHRAITFAASANCLRYVGAEAGFVDIDPEHARHVVPRRWNRRCAAPRRQGGDPGASRRARSRRRRDPPLAGGRIVIEDAAHAFGGSYACGRPVGCGAYSDMTILSFHPVKTDHDRGGRRDRHQRRRTGQRLRMLRSHGMERDPAAFVVADAHEDGRVKPWFHEQQMLGFNYRMTDIQAALGLVATRQARQFPAPPPRDRAALR